jgi:hypothetical protein
MKGTFLILLYTNRTTRKRRRRRRNKQTTLKTGPFSLSLSQYVCLILFQRIIEFIFSQSPLLVVLRVHLSVESWPSWTIVAVVEQAAYNNCSSSISEWFVRRAVCAVKYIMTWKLYTATKTTATRIGERVGRVVLYTEASFSSCQTYFMSRVLL